MDLPAILSECYIFPCIAGTKKPAIPQGFLNASNSEDQIKLWRQANPNFNWALSTGHSGIFVFDIDPAGLVWWENLLNINENIKEAVKKAFKVQTPKGGMHVYFQGSGPSTSSAIAEGIDTRGGIWSGDKLVSGGYVLLPGSQTVEGPGCVDGKYEALGGILQPLPECLKALIPERKIASKIDEPQLQDRDLPRNIQTARDLLSKYVTDKRVAVEGKGGDSLTFSVAASVLDKGISCDKAAELIKEIWNPHCIPPWDDWEIDQKVLNAWQYGEETKSGAKGFQPNEAVFSGFQGYEITETKKPRTSRFAPMWLSDARKDWRPAKWLIHNILPAEGVGVIYGLSGSYKTFFALDMALCLAHGIPGQWGAVAENKTVLFLAGENSYSLQQERVDAWCEEHGRKADESRFVLVRGVPAYGNVEAWQEIKEGLKTLGVKPDLIIVDTLTRMMSGLKENSNDDAKLSIDLLENMAYEYGGMAVAIAHTGKDQMKGIRGGQAFHDNSDFVAFTKKIRNGLTSFTIKKLKEVDVTDEPEYFQVKKIGSSMVLKRTQASEEAPKARGSKYGWAAVSEVISVLQSLGGSTSLEVLSSEISGIHGLDKSLIKAQLTRNSELQFLQQEKGIWRIPGKDYDL